jgi:heme-degrading monooxygenase HmoA
LKISLQAKKERGFIGMKNTGFGYMHYTLSWWESDEDVKRFARSRAHLEAMKQSQRLASEIRVHTFSGSELPGWTQTKRLLIEKGTSFTYK